MTDKREAILARIDEWERKRLAYLPFANNGGRNSADVLKTDHQLRLLRALRNQVEKHHKKHPYFMCECGRQGCKVEDEVFSDLGLANDR
jgi:hypothetical protein